MLWAMGYGVWAPLISSRLLSFGRSSFQFNVLSEFYLDLFS